MNDSTESRIPDRLDLFPNGEIGIVWRDAHESFYAPRDLRCACPCAACVDETTGKKILDDRLVREDVGAVGLERVGNYGIQFVWSDGHSTGIYSHALLRSLCPCPECRTARGD